VIHAANFFEADETIDQLASMMYVPIVVGRKNAGILVAGDEAGATLTASQRRLLETFAHQAATAIQRIKAILAAEQKRLEDLVEHPAGRCAAPGPGLPAAGSNSGERDFVDLEMEIEDGFLTHPGRAFSG
jgi:GAF domain-containing protein